MANSENFTAENTVGLKEIGILRNNWRKRHCLVYQHPRDPDKVVSVGIPFGQARTDAIVCIENKLDWNHTISKYPEVDVYN